MHTSLCVHEVFNIHEVLPAREGHPSLGIQGLCWGLITKIYLATLIAAHSLPALQRSTDTMWRKGSTLNHIVGVAQSYHSKLHCYYLAGPRHPGKQRHFYPGWTFQGLRGYLPGDKGKGQTFLWVSLLLPTHKVNIVVHESSIWLWSGHHGLVYWGHN